MKTKHLFLLATLALTLFSCENNESYCNADFQYIVSGRTVTFSCNSEYHNGSIDNYAWDFGDGTILNDVGTSGTQTHAYNKPGDYVVTMWIVFRDAKNIIWGNNYLSANYKCVCTKTITINE